MSESKAYIVAADMGYGHQRAVFPLSHIAALPKGWSASRVNIITANDYPGIPDRDKIKWFLTRKTYELISRTRSFPILGRQIFRLMDFIEKIPPFFPKRDLSKPILPLYTTYILIKKGLGRHLIDLLNEKPLPLIVSFPILAIMAEVHGYSGNIYCLCTDTDISRAWVAINPKESRVRYLAPTEQVKERLVMYGVQPDRITVTGFPLPTDSIERQVIDRLARLTDQNSPMTVTFAVGGAGAQAEIGVRVMESLRNDIISDKMRLNLVAGTSKKIERIFENSMKELGLEHHYGRGLNIIYKSDKYEYFEAFNGILTKTDVLWTKPSELSFYAGLGLPIVMAPALGVQEDSNRQWLHVIGAGIEQLDPHYANEWLDDWRKSGWLSRAATSGYACASSDAVETIRKLMK